MRIEDWIVRTQTTTDIIAPKPARFMQATLDRHPALDSGDSLPPLWHWLYFLEALPANQLGRDAHPKKGGFLPPVDLPRRMWAGGRFAFDHPVIIGREATKRSTITKVENKTGRSGVLGVFGVFWVIRYAFAKSMISSIAKIQRRALRNLCPNKHRTHCPRIFQRC